MSNKCPNELCEEIVTNITIIDHLKDCQFKKVKCAFCNSELLKIELETHLSNCYQVKIPCQFGCDKSFSNKEIEEHKKVCEFRTEKCKYCEELVISTLMPQHILENKEKHLDTLLQRVENLENKQQQQLQQQQVQQQQVPVQQEESICQQRRRMRRQCAQKLKSKLFAGFELAQQKVRTVIDEAEQKFSQTSSEQIKDYVSKGIVIFFIIFAMSFFLPWFLKLPLFIMAAKKLYKKKVKTSFPENKWIGWLYFVLCWWIYVRVLC